MSAGAWSATTACEVGAQRISLVTKRAVTRAIAGTEPLAFTDAHRQLVGDHQWLWEDPRVPSPPTITPVRVADLLAEGERMPVYVHVIDHPDARVLVDTGMTELHPAVADLDPRLRPLSEQDFDLAGIDIVVNTHLHFDHCGGNHLFAGMPIYVQRRELDDARSQDDYTIREWVEAPGLRYVPVDGELELLPGLRLVPAPGHTPGLQVVVIETGGRPVVVGGDVAVWFGELDEPRTEGQLRVRALDPELVWLAHEHEPWRPRTA
jgi:N-acyl homoserine lactone hydrolase